MDSHLTDTDPEAERVFIDMLRRAPLWKRLALASGLSCTCRLLALADLRRRYPTADEDELHRRMAARLLPREDVIRAFDWDPEEHGY
jgi:hypothetical protein